MTTVPVVVFAVIRIMEVVTAPLYYLIAFLSNRKRIPAATNPILTTSASVLAEKIRAREVRWQTPNYLRLFTSRHIHSLVT